MKRVIDETISKSGEVIRRFYPTARMILFAQNKGKNSFLSESEICKEIGISTNLPSIWAKKYGSQYTEWLDEFIDNYTDKKAELLEAVGMVEATQGSYQHWRDMARTHGVIKEENKPLSLTINTDFSAILIGDLDEAKRRILQEVRGVVVEARTGVAADTRRGEREGAGGGTGDVQEVPLAIPDTLDTNRRQPE